MKIYNISLQLNNPLNKLWIHFHNDSLFRNSIYLMSNTGIISVFGFIFWIMIAKLYTTEQIGLATTMISTISFITSFSLLGFDIGIIRYLAKSKCHSKQINTCFLITALASFFIATIFIIGLNIFSPKLLFIKENYYFISLFILFAIFSTSNTLIDNIFIAFRNAKFVLIKNTIFSILKLILPLLFISIGTYGIFNSYMISLMIGFFIGFIILIARFGYRPSPIIHKNTIKEIGHYSFGNYTANFISSLPTMILPLMITNLLKPETTAYYYIAMMIVGIIFIIPGATTQSLLAEGSNNEEDLRNYIYKSIKIIAPLLFPAILITVLFGKYILLFFGNNYSTEGFRFLQILAFSGIFVSINSIFGTILKLKLRVKKMIIINSIGTISIIGLSYLLITEGLLGIGIAWISGQALVSLVYYGTFIKSTNK